MTHAKQTEPPSYREFPRFVVGQDRCGNWVVQNKGRTRGGMFVDRIAALRYVRSEVGDRPSALIITSGVIELEMAAPPDAMPKLQPDAYTSSLRRVA
jgi:hypothetical protein